MYVQLPHITDRNVYDSRAPIFIYESTYRRLKLLLFCTINQSASLDEYITSISHFSRDVRQLATRLNLLLSNDEIILMKSTNLSIMILKELCCVLTILIVQIKFDKRLFFLPILCPCVCIRFILNHWKPPAIIATADWWRSCTFRGLIGSDLSTCHRVYNAYMCSWIKPDTNVVGAVHRLNDLNSNRGLQRRDDEKTRIIDPSDGDSSRVARHPPAENYSAWPLIASNPLHTDLFPAKNSQ